MKDDGLTLLLLFSYGALSKNLCGSPSFSGKVRAFLRGKDGFRESIKEDAPKQLTAAWPMLCLIGKELGKSPLALATIETYLYGHPLLPSTIKDKTAKAVSGWVHNSFTLEPCRVRMGIVQQIGQRSLRVKIFKGEGTKIENVRFLKPYSEDLKKGDRISFHHNWLIGKVPENLLI